MLKGIHFKPASDFENLALPKLGINKMVLEHRRNARPDLDNLRSLSPAYVNRKGGNKRSTASLAVGLRDIGKELGIGAYSINVLLGLLNNVSTKKIAEWRYVNHTKTVIYQLAMGVIEQEQIGKWEDQLMLIPFVFNLSLNLQKRMTESKRKEVAACMAILSRDLSKGLNRKVDFWFQLEMASKGGKGRPHIQGAILLAKKEQRRAREIFHKANGDVSLEFKSRALWFCTNGRKSVAKKNGLLYADINWSLYCAKESGLTRIFYTNQNQPKLTNIVAVTDNLRSEAIRLYERLRMEHMAFLHLK